MSFELIHAWAIRGIDGDGPGFVTVARTAGLPRGIERLAVAHSGHRLPEDQRPTIALRRFDRPDGGWAMLTATTPSGDDRRIAHHLVLDETELPRIDLAATISRWRAEPSLGAAPQEREAPPSPPPAQDRPTEPAAAWQRALGDAGWAGEAIARMRGLAGEPLVVLLPGEIDTAPLAADIVQLLPSTERSTFTFADRLRRADEGLRLVLLDEIAIGIAEKALPGGAALLDVRSIGSRTSPSAPEHADAEAARAGGALISMERERRDVRIGSVEATPSEPTAVWSGPIEVRLEEPRSKGTGWLAAVVVIVIMLTAIYAFASPEGVPIGALS